MTYLWVLWRKITQGNGATFWERRSLVSMTVMPHRKMVSEKMWVGDERETILMFQWRPGSAGEIARPRALRESEAGILQANGAGAERTRGQRFVRNKPLWSLSDTTKTWIGFEQYLWLPLDSLKDGKTIDECYERQSWARAPSGKLPMQSRVFISHTP